MIYLDTSALLKLVHEEAESGGLEQWLTHRSPTSFVSSEVVRVELVRACGRVDPTALPGARALLLGLDLVPLTRAVLEQAADVGDAGLRSLEAIHLASTLVLGGHLSAFVAYDRRLLDAATALNLTIVSPA